MDYFFHFIVGEELWWGIVAAVDLCSHWYININTAGCAKDWPSHNSLEKTHRPVGFYSESWPWPPCTCHVYYWTSHQLCPLAAYSRAPLVFKPYQNCPLEMDGIAGISHVDLCWRCSGRLWCIHRQRIKCTFAWTRLIWFLCNQHCAAYIDARC